MQSKSSLLLTLGLALGSHLVNPSLIAEERSQKPPNILWLIVDNCNLDFRCFGAQHVFTPNIDSIAAEGVRYTKVYATAPVCAPCRSAFMTGMYQTTLDLQHFPSHRNDGYRLPKGVRPLTHRLNDAGYTTAVIKNIMLNGKEEHVGSGKLDLNFSNEGQIFDTTDWSVLKDSQPFFAQVNTPEAEYDIYDFKTYEKERVPWWGEEEHPQYAKPEMVTPPRYFPDHPVSKQEWASYLNAISAADRRLGKVLEKLKEDGLEDDTIIILFGDNGRLDHRSIHWVYNSGLHVPLIVRFPKNYPAPEHFKPGTIDDRLVSLLDLTATTLSLANIERPLGMQSRIFLGKDADPERKYVFAARDRIDGVHHRLRSVHDERYHYIKNFHPEINFGTYVNFYKEKCFPQQQVMRQQYADGTLKKELLPLFEHFGDELYDLQADPDEVNNLINSDKPEHQAALMRLGAAMDVWLTETGDVGGTLLESPELRERFREITFKWFGAPDWYHFEPKSDASAEELINRGRIVK